MVQIYNCIPRSLYSYRIYLNVGKGNRPIEWCPCSMVPSMATLGSLIFQLPVECHQSVRKLEKVSSKVARLKCSLLFNRTCLKEK